MLLTCIFVGVPLTPEQAKNEFLSKLFFIVGMIVLFSIISLP